MRLLNSNVLVETAGSLYNHKFLLVVVLYSVIDNVTFVIVAFYACHSSSNLSRTRDYVLAPAINIVRMMWWNILVVVVSFKLLILHDVGDFDWNLFSFFRISNVVLVVIDLDLVLPCNDS